MKVLIADDEEYIRRGIGKSIDWNSLGVEKMLMAEDGIAALKICEKECPEIIITDIRMPGLDGLELAETARERFGAEKVIILSGYSEFEYGDSAKLQKSCGDKAKTVKRNVRWGK